MRHLSLLFVPSFAIGLQAQSWTLDQCLRRAEEKNLAVRNAALDAQLADRAHDQAYWSFLPDLNAAATHGYNWGKAIDRFTNTFATDRVRTNNLYLSSNYTLFESGRRHHELKQAELNEEAAIKGLEAARNDIRTEVVRAYLNVLGLRERLSAAEQQMSVTRDQVARTQALLDAGRVARSELLDNEAQLAQEEYTATDLRNQSALAMLGLAQLMQLTPEEMKGFDIVKPAIGELAIAEPTVSEEEVLRNVLANNPAYKQAELQSASAERGVSIAKTQVLPSISFNASLGTGYSGRNLEYIGEPVPDGNILIGATEEGVPVYAPSFSQDSRVRAFGAQLDDNLNESVGFTLSVPIFNNMRTRYGVDQARIQLEKAKNTMETQRNALQVDVQNAITAQRGAYRQYESARRSVAASEESMRYADERFLQNAITAVELSTMKARLQKATADLINAKYTYLMSAKSLDILQGLPVTL
ncbi:MAG TPA: TolC family protein [Flavobacteriales bacterium]